MEAQHHPRGRMRLAKVLKASGDVIDIGTAVQVLQINRSEASRLLSRWTNQGWLRRVGAGKYVAATIESLDSPNVLADPWVLVPALFSPAYIGGWSAAEYWALTEQIFREIVVITEQTVRKKRQVRQGTTFLLHHIQPDLMFGTRTVWRERSKVMISDPERTIVDMMDNPILGGGIQHTADCLSSYLGSSSANMNLLLEYGDRIGNGAIFKRLGFLVERHGGYPELLEACRIRLTKGNAILDASLDCSRLATRWKLRVPENWLMKD